MSHDSDHAYSGYFPPISEPLFDLSSYINNSSLRYVCAAACLILFARSVPVIHTHTHTHSDVVLISEDGQRFFAHRLVMCAQSPVLKTMLDSELWAESKNKEVWMHHRLFCMKITQWILT